MDKTKQGAAAPHSLGVTEVLQRARERVRQGWVQGYAGYTDASAVLVCAQGAIWREVAPTYPDTKHAPVLWEAFVKACEHMERALGVRRLAPWNDAPGRTKAEVLDGFGKAIALAPAAQPPSSAIPDKEKGP